MLDRLHCDEPGSSLWRIQLFSGFRLRDPDGVELITKSRRMVALLTLLAFQRDFSIDRHTLAKIIFWDVEENHEERLKVLLSRISSKLQSRGISFLKVTSDLVWIDDRHVEIDVETARKLISEIGERAKAGKPVIHLFEQLGSVISTLDVTVDTPYLVTAADRLKQGFLQQIQTHLVPAVGVQHSALVGALLESMNLEEPLSSNICCQLMSIYSGLGDTSSVHRVFARHEEAVAEEYGDAVSKSVAEAYALALDGDAFPGVTAATDLVPARCAFSYGFDKFVEKLLGAIESSQKGDTFLLIGCEGAGKTHILSRLWHEHNETKTFSYIDLNYAEEEPEHLFARHRNSDVLLIDNFDSSGVDFMRFMRQSNQSQIIVFTGRVPTQYSGVTTLQVPRLSAGNRLEKGSAVELLGRALLLDDYDEDSVVFARDLKYFHQLAMLTGGIPGALINCAQIVKSLGAKSALNYVQDELTAISTKRIDASTFSLRTNVLSRISELNQDQLTCCRLLVRINAPISAELVSESGEIPVGVFDELIQLGIIFADSRGFYTLEPSVLQVLNGSSIGTINPVFWQDFCNGVLLWLNRRAEMLSQNLDVADSFEALTVVCEAMMQRDDPSKGIEMFCTMSKWFASVNFPKELAIQAESLIVSQPPLHPSQLVDQVCAVGGAYFHKGLYSKMLQILRWGKNSLELQQTTAAEQSRIFNNLGLAYRCIEDYNNARSCYVQALELTTDSENRVKLNFNLGCLAESSGNVQEALSYYELAAGSYSGNTDYRLLSQNTLSILRLRNRFDADPSASEDLINDLFRESQVARDRYSQATILLDIGEIKCSNGQAASGIYFMITGVLLSLQHEYSKNTISKFSPTLAILSDELRKIGRSAQAEKIEVISLGMAETLRNDIWNADGKDMLPVVLKEVLLQCLQPGVLDRSAWPTELDHLVEENMLLEYTDFSDVPVTPFIESLRARFKIMSVSAAKSAVQSEPVTQEQLDASRN